MGEKSNILLGEGKMLGFYEEIGIPETDLWSTLFEREDKLFLDDQGVFSALILFFQHAETEMKSNNFQSFIPLPPLHTHTPPSDPKPSLLASVFATITPSRKAMSWLFSRKIISILLLLCGERII